METRLNNEEGSLARKMRFGVMQTDAPWWYGGGVHPPSAAQPATHFIKRGKRGEGLIL